MKFQFEKRSSFIKIRRLIDLENQIIKYKKFKEVKNKEFF